MSKYSIYKKVPLVLLSVSLAVASAMAISQETTEKPSLPSNTPQFVLKNKDFESSLPSHAKEWLNLIKQKNPELNCPQSSSYFSCLFLASANIDLINGEMNISLKGSSFVDGYLALPQISKVASQEINSKIWAKNILVNGKVGEVVEKDGKLMVGVDKGDFEIKLILSKNTSSDVASFEFDNAPLILISNIKNKEFIKEGNVIRLSQSMVTTSMEPIKGNNKIVSEDELEINVYRKISPQIPNILSTQIKIIYSGKPKDFYLGKILPEGFEFNTANSPLKIEKKDDGFWVKLVAGENTINIESFLLKDALKIDTKGLVNSVSNEIWSVEQNANVRQIEVESNQQLDPKQALVPSEWSHLPTYLVGDSFKIKNNRRGLEENKNLKMQVRRDSYFGFAGENMIHIDNMELENYGNQFLKKTDPLLFVENFSINENNQVLVNANNNLGVIIPKGKFTAKSQSVSNTLEPATQFWEGSTEIKNWTINLAPRMRMFAVTGESIESSGTWLNHWNLYSVFSLFLIVLTFFKLFGKKIAAMALIGILIFPSQVFSWTLWLSILFVLGLLKVLPDSSESKFSKIVSRSGLFMFGLFCLYFLDFIKKEIQLIINPSLETVSNSLSFFDPDYYVILLILAVVLSFISLMDDEPETLDKNKSNVAFSQAVTLLIISAALLALPSFLKSGQESVFGTGSGRSTSIGGQPLMPVGDESDAPAPPAAPRNHAYNEMSLSSVVSKEYKREEIVNKIMIKKAQVGSGIPDWEFGHNSYDIKSEGAITKNSTVKFWIAPVWLVDILSVVQILFLSLTLFVFGIGLLHLSNRKDWFNKLPKGLRESKLVQTLLLNELKKGLTK